MSTRRHSIKIDAMIKDQSPHIARPITWYAIECSCGWSSALHAKETAARAAYVRHRKQRPVLGAAA